ncbi:YagK/YfjJ domain-containing protein [Shewanella sedimentimangrovi]|uniref:Inovirus-type Gp2 protein n=1 Tax=Shewanella sedimentimangrovi TaxID=2814293 RepID=A0ABX7R257_9GAMM|nr:inovirus-type Gp2 protein [Shewanella sedimentimangrovi]QSX37564.1 inovirus-type Gp2 protein [Shewanella sedimentimangrovi]
MAISTTKKNNQSKKTSRRFYLNRFNSMPFAYKDHAYEVYKPITGTLNPRHLETIFSDYESILSHYSRVLVCRIDLHPNAASLDNQPINAFLAHMANTLTALYKSKVIYHCAREQNTSDKEHYHLAIMLSGHKIRHPGQLLKLVQSLWSSHSGGTASMVDNPYCLIKRGDKASLRDAIYRSSYFAKTHTKENNRSIKGFISNRLKPAAKFDPSTDLMLVDPGITFEHNRRKQTFEQAQLPTSNTKRSISLPRGWFNTYPEELQLREAIANRTSSLNHLLYSPGIGDSATMV